MAGRFIVTAVLVMLTAALILSAGCTESAGSPPGTHTEPAYEKFSGIWTSENPIYSSKYGTFFIHKICCYEDGTGYCAFVKDNRYLPPSYFTWQINDDGNIELTTWELSQKLFGISDKMILTADAESVYDSYGYRYTRDTAEYSITTVWHSINPHYEVYDNDDPHLFYSCDYIFKEDGTVSLIAYSNKKMIYTWSGTWTKTCGNKYTVHYSGDSIIESKGTEDVYLSEGCLADSYGYYYYPDGYYPDSIIGLWKQTSSMAYEKELGRDVYYKESFFLNGKGIEIAYDENWNYLHVFPSEWTQTADKEYRIAYEPRGDAFKETIDGNTMTGPDGIDYIKMRPPEENDPFLGIWYAPARDDSAETSLFIAMIVFEDGTGARGVYDGGELSKLGRFTWKRLYDGTFEIITDEGRKSGAYLDLGCIFSDSGYIYHR